MSDFIRALNEYFYYDKTNMDDFKDHFYAEYPEKRANLLMDFLCWYENDRGNQLDNALEQLEFYKDTFPLQTQQSMSERWGKSRQNIAAWATRDPHFPREIEGLIEKTGRTPKYYPLHEVLRFEREKGLDANV